MTQADVADRLGMARTNYLRFESGPDAPAAATLAAMASVLGVAPQTLTTTAPDQVTLRDLREYAGLTHQQAAEAIGYSAGRSYRDLETAGKALTPDLARGLAKAFGVTERKVRAAWKRTSKDER